MTDKSIKYKNILKPLNTLAQSGIAFSGNAQLSFRGMAVI